MSADVSSHESPMKSRRALLAGALGGLGAWAASAIGRASPVRAGVDGDVVLGGSNSTGLTTSITNATDSANTMFYVATGVGGAFFGQSVSGDAVTGYSNTRFGVWGGSGTATGVHGSGGTRGVSGSSSAGHGLHGHSESGWAGYFDGKVFTNRFIELAEIANPSAPNKNRARLFLRESASGATQLCVRFHNGTIRVLASS